MSEIFGMINTETIEELADIINRKELSEITLTDGGKTITVKGKKNPPPMPMGFAPAQPGVVATPAETEAPKAKGVSGNVVKSPIIGTFYSASAPDKAPFVTVGSTVKQGDVLFIIESMKVMNEVQSEFDGTVKEILVKNGDTLEFDQPVMIIG